MEAGAIVMISDARAGDKVNLVRFTLDGFNDGRDSVPPAYWSPVLLTFRTDPNDAASRRLAARPFAGAG